MDTCPINKYFILTNHAKLHRENIIITEQNFGNLCKQKKPKLSLECHKSQLIPKCPTIPMLNQEPTL